MKLKETFLRLAKDSLIVAFVGFMSSAVLAALAYSREGVGFVPMIPAGLILGTVFSGLGIIFAILYKLWR